MWKYKNIALIAFLIAVAITATMDFTGYTMFSALPLIAIIAIFWLIVRMSGKEIGLMVGSRKQYAIAIFYPIIILGITAAVAYLYGDISIKEIHVKNELLNLIAGLIIGPIMLVLTEEGFFRGWLWGTLQRAGFSSNKTLHFTTAMFVIWHISAVTTVSDYGLPLYQVPVYLTNAALLGLIWGTLRNTSGSIFVPALCHAIWNTFAYGLFGFGEKVGLLGVTDTFLLGPEVGYLGIILNGLFYLWLRKHSKPIQPMHTAME